MKTKTRLITILFIAIIEFFIVYVSYFLFIGNSDELSNGELFAGIFFTIVFLGGILAIIRFYIVIHIDINRKVLTLKYPLLFKREILAFDDIIGFRFKDLSGGWGPDYKVLQLKGKNGKKYSISDFEKSNLKAFEMFYIETFDLYVGNGFRKLDTHEKEMELGRNVEFDFQQAKEIRLVTLLSIPILLVIAVMAVALIFEADEKNIYSPISGLIIILIFLKEMIYKFMKAVQLIRNVKQKR